MRDVLVPEERAECTGGKAGLCLAHGQDRGLHGGTGLPLSQVRAAHRYGSLSHRKVSGLQ